MIESFEDFIGIGGKRLFDQLNPLISSTILLAGAKQLGGEKADGPHF